jgi:peptide/nickel transport system ATP-binding protein
MPYNPSAPPSTDADGGGLRRDGAPLIAIEGLRTDIALKSATVHAVDGVDLEVWPGETVGLVGESGSGKTMTGMSVMRLLPNGGRVVGGAIRFGDLDLATADLSTMRRVRGNEIGMVFQDPMTSLNPTMTVGHQIAESVRWHRGVSDQEATVRATEVLDLVGMPNPRQRLGDYPHQLSGGLRQRVMIAIALACEPKLLIADEPTTALDVTIQAQILQLLDRLKAELGMGMLLITHDMGVIAGRADRVAVMYAGEIVETTTTAALFGEMRHPYTEALLASIPQLDQDTTKPLYSIPGLPPDLTHPPQACRFAPRCLYATERCTTERPVLEGPEGHRFACFHPRSESVTEAEEGVAQALRDMQAQGRLTDTQAVLAGAEAIVSGLEVSDKDILVEVEHISREFTVTAGSIMKRKIGTLKAVSDLNMRIRRGETFGLVGESGCGKTTLGRLMVSLDQATDGRVLFEGEDVTALKERALTPSRVQRQMMFQDPYASLDPRMRVKDIIREPLAIHKVDRDVGELLDEVGLPRRAANRYPHEFSGGQRQRIGLARALALSPKLIVADEPVSALDVSIRSQVLNLMKALQVRHGLTYVVISHDLSVVRYLADRIGVMYLGKLVEVGTGEDIYSRAAHPYTAGLLETIPVPNPTVERAKRKAGMKGELPSPINPPSGCRFRTRCPRADDICATEVPDLTPFGGEHFAACHHPLQEPVTLTTKDAAAR